MARILVVEDEPLIAMMIEDWLTELGHATAGPAHSVADALGLIASVPVDCGIVDVTLRAESSLPVAEELRRRAIPFVLATGRAAETAGEGAFAGVPVLAKPFDFEGLRTAVDALLDATPA